VRLVALEAKWNGAPQHRGAPQDATGAELLDWLSLGVLHRDERHDPHVMRDEDGHGREVDRVRRRDVEVQRVADGRDRMLGGAAIFG